MTWPAQEGYTNFDVDPSDVQDPTVQHFTHRGQGPAGRQYQDIPPLRVTVVDPVHIKQDGLNAPKAPPDDVNFIFKTYTPNFAGATNDPELIMAHTRRRRRAFIKVNGTPFIAAISPATVANQNGGNAPATGVAFQSPYGFPVQVVISANGATITNVSVNGITVGTAAGTYFVPAYGAISVAYSVATPTWVWSNPASTIPASGNSNVYLCETKSSAQQTQPQPQGMLLSPGDRVWLNGTTEVYLVAFGSGTAPSVSVAQEIC